jgi:glucokinase
VTPDVARCLALDVGGTKLMAGVVDRAGQVLVSARRPTPDASDAAVVLDALLDAANEVLRGAAGPVAVCGVGCGGPMRLGRTLVSPLNIPAWRDFPLAARLADALGLPVGLDNDAKALALAEGWLGAARGSRAYVALVVSTGVGGGVVLDGRLLEGREGNAGHIGHVIVEPDGRRCGCGARGCLEAEASGPAIAARTGRPPEEANLAARQRAGRMVGRAVASVANLLDLDLAVVGGSVALGFGAPFFQAAQAELEARARLEFSRGARIVPSALGAVGPLLGAAAVGFRALDDPGAVVARPDARMPAGRPRPAGGSTSPARR